MAQISLKVNGKAQLIDAEADMPLLYALRNDLQLNGPKFGCGLAQCGACPRHHGRQRHPFLRYAAVNRPE